jgi:hypothetical protein
MLTQTELTGNAPALTTALKKLLREKHIVVIGVVANEKIYAHRDHAALNPQDFIAEQLLTRASKLTTPFFSCKQLLGRLPNQQEQQGIAVLVKRDALVYVGMQTRTKQYALPSGNNTQVTKLAVAERVMRQIADNRSKPLPITAQHKEWKKNLPSGLRSVIPQVIRQLKEQRKVITFRVGNSNLFFFETQVLQQLAMTMPPASSETQEPAWDPALVQAAYRRLKERTRSPHVFISDLQQESGMPLAPLQAWLQQECRAHRAVPTRGEPTLATAEQLAAALSIQDEPHLYIQLD